MRLQGIWIFDVCAAQSKYVFNPFIKKRIQEQYIDNYFLSLTNNKFSEMIRYIRAVTPICFKERLI